MSRRTAIVEEFDDDTDLPLPNQPLPNTGSKGPLLEEIIPEDDFLSRAGPASPSFIPPQQYLPTVTDVTPYKTWTCIYPIYLDAKRPYGTGQRRISRAKSLWWPLSKDIVDASQRLGLPTLHEVTKSHPRDWENPGRVRVHWKKSGNIRTKKQLLENIAFQIQLLKPENIPKPPYSTTASTAVAKPAPVSTSNKGKAPANAKVPANTKVLAKSKSPAVPKTGGRRLPIPPEPQPPFANRVSPYSPAISTGVLIETVKAGMNAQEANPPGQAPGTPGSPAGAQKGKRKVVRVRG
ncbi:signal recognition particle, SRP19 subunit [Mycena floridula]|nr:signal recognition particle, SRP19 subunit [Mycena floridula]